MQKKSADRGSHHGGNVLEKSTNCEKIPDRQEQEVQRPRGGFVW